MPLFDNNATFFLRARVSHHADGFLQGIRSGCALTRSATPGSGDWANLFHSEDAIATRIQVAGCGCRGMAGRDWPFVLAKMGGSLLFGAIVLFRPLVGTNFD